MERRKSILEIASGHLRTSKEEQVYNRRKDSKRTDRKPYVGQRVYIKETPSVGVKSKLARKWKGPYRIKTVLPHNRIVVEEIKNNPKQHTIHLDHAKLLGEIEIDQRYAPSARQPFPPTEAPSPQLSGEARNHEETESENYELEAMTVEFPSTTTVPPVQPVAAPPTLPPPPGTPPRVRTPTPPLQNPAVDPQRVQQGRGRGRPHNRHSTSPYRAPPNMAPPGPSNIRTRSQLAGLPSAVGLYAEDSSDEEI